MSLVYGTMLSLFEDAIRPLVGTTDDEGRACLSVIIAQHEVEKYIELPEDLSEYVVFSGIDPEGVDADEISLFLFDRLPGYVITKYDNRAVPERWEFTRLCCGNWLMQWTKEYDTVLAYWPAINALANQYSIDKDDVHAVVCNIFERK